MQNTARKLEKPPRWTRTDGTQQRHVKVGNGWIRVLLGNGEAITLMMTPNNLPESRVHEVLKEIAHAIEAHGL